MKRTAYSITSTHGPKTGLHAMGRIWMTSGRKPLGIKPVGSLRIKGLLIFLLLSLTSLVATAVNKLSIPVLEIGAGKEASVPISLSNDSQVVAVQFRLQLPAGFTMSDTSHLTLSDRKTNHTVSVKRMSSREYLVVMFSLTNSALRGNSGVLFHLPVLVPDTCQTGNVFAFRFSEVILSAKSGINLESPSDPGGLKIIDTPRPDFSIENVQPVTTNMIPGQSATLSWNVKNVGTLKTSAGWSENVSLVAENGETVFLGTVYSDQLLNVGESVSRQSTFNLSPTIGVDGNVRVQVKITPYKGSGELPASTFNNQANSVGTATMKRLLQLSLSRDALGENETDPLLTHVYRSGSRLTEQTFSLSTNNASRLKIPETVSIPMGNSGSVFYVSAIDNNYASLDTTITVSVSGNGYEPAKDSISLVDNELPALTITTSKSVVNEGETFTLTLSRQLVTGDSLRVMLNTDLSGRTSFKSENVIPANVKSITVTVTTTDDLIPRMNAQPMFTATASGFTKSSCTVELIDNDVPTIQMSLTPETVSESAGYQAVVGVVKRLGTTNNAISIKLNDNSNGNLFYSNQTITLEKGVSQMKFTVGVVDNDQVDGTRNFTVQAAVYLSDCGCTASGSNGGTVQGNLVILDDDGPALKLSTSQTMLPEGKANAAYLTLTRNTSTAEALSVTLGSDHAKDLNLPSPVVIPMGSTSVQVPISAIKNDSIEGDRTATINATANGYSKGVCWVMITDQTLTDATVKIASLSSPTALAKTSVDVNVQVKNEGVVKLLTYQTVEIYYSKDSLNLSTAADKLLNIFYTSKDILPGSSEQFTTTVTLPDLTGPYYLFAVVNPDQKTKELSYLNNTSKPASILLQAPFTGIVQADKDIYKPGEMITLTGQITARGNSNIAGVAVEIYMLNNSDRTKQTATTDANGAFQLIYKPYAGQIGHFSLGVCYPNEGLEMEQDIFDIYGLRRTTFSNLTWDVLVNEDNTGEIELINPGNLALTNLKTTVTSDTTNYSLTFDPISYMQGGGKKMLKYHLKAKNPSTGNDWERVYFQVKSDEGATADLTAYFYGRTAQGSLSSNISSIQTTMSKGSVRNYSFTVTNKGKGVTGAITVLIPKLSWLSLVTPATIPSLSTGESSTITLQLAPGSDLPANVPFYGTIGINCENGNGIPLPFRIETVSEKTGNLLVDVCDEYTYYTAEAPHLAGATVVVKHPYTQAIVAQGVTNDKGIFRADSLPEGYYTLVVTAPKHDTYTNNILIDPGKTNSSLINLSFQAITYTWNVVETEIIDEYTLVSTVKFETMVPTPVVVTETPDKIDGASILPGQFIIYNTVVTNKGLLTAKDVNITIPSRNGNLVFEALTETRFDLKPQSSVIIPIKVTNVGTTSGSAAMRSASAINDISCGVQTITIYYWDCGLDRKWHEYSKSMNVFVCVSNSPSGYSPGGGGGGYPFGPGGGGTSSYVPNYNTDPPSVSDYSCEPCQNRFMYKMSMCLLKRVPIIGQVIEIIEVVQEVQEVLTDGTIKIERIVERIPKVGEKIVGYFNIYKDCIEPLFEKCVPGDLGMPSKNKKSPDAATDSSVTLLSYMVYYQGVMRRLSNMMDAAEAQRMEIFNDSAWINLTWNELNDFWDKLILIEGKVDSTSEIKNYKPAKITNQQFTTFLDRWNNTRLGIKTTNVIDQKHLRACYDSIAAVMDYAKKLGYNSAAEMFNKETEIYQKEASEASKNVCASITLKFSQTLTMTRQAFRGTLTIFNGNEKDAMKEVKLNLVIVDMNGNQVGSHEFQVATEKLDKLTAIDGTGTLDAQQTGVATILFIPTKYAAPTIPQEYSFGGTLSYLDPFSGTTVTRELYPATLTVRPSPDLYLTYFMQRDVWGDDALTQDVVEEMVPAEFSLLIQNKGAGDATKVNISSKQPEIVDNEKGLLIDFELIASSLNGAPGSYGVTDINFGTIPSGTCTFGQWWFTSTLLGHFIDYDVSVTHVTSYDNPDLSLIGGATIHELIRSVNADSASVKRTGFLVNDQTDREDLPDILYLSDGTTRDVSLLGDTTLAKISDNVYTLTVTPATPGWKYGVFADPVLGKQELLSATRQSDGKNLNLRNIWQTDRTLRDGRDPLYEFRIHLADEIKTASETYTLNFEPKRENVLSVVSFDSIPEKVSNKPVQTVLVRFNRPIADSTFTREDLKLNCQGQPVNLDSVSISYLDSVTYALHLNSATKLNGYFVLTVQTREVRDAEGFEGKLGKTATWNQYLGTGVVLSLKVQPEGSGVLTPDSTHYTYGTTVRFKAKAKAGYRFKEWTVNGESVSTDTLLSQLATEQKNIVGQFEPLYCNLTITTDLQQGTVTGAETGVYQYGSLLKLKAVPALNYKFTGWFVNGVQTSTKDSIEITLVKGNTVEARFSSTLFPLEIPLGQGWNWISNNYSDAAMKNPMQFLASVQNRILKVLSYNDELVVDPVLGITGGLKLMSAAESYKLNVFSDCNLSLLGAPYKPSAVNVNLAQGWNWIGYIPSTTLTPAVALANANPQIDEVIKNQTDFSIYSGSAWVGTLNQMKPGEGYMYLAKSPRSFTYNQPAGAQNLASKPLRASVQSENGWFCNVRQYPDNMNMILQLRLNNVVVNPDDYTLGAFVGDECRGLGKTVNNLSFLTLFGEQANETIHFRVLEKASGLERVVLDSTFFGKDLVGTLAQPKIIRLGALITDLDANARNFVLYPNPVKDKLYLSSNQPEVYGVRIYSSDGRLLSIYDGNAYLNGVDVSTLPGGIYIITLSTSNGTYHQKFTKLQQ